MAAPDVLCPQCGGALHPDEGQHFLICPFCASAVYLDKAQVVFHWSIQPTLDEAGARAALRRWMAGNDTVKDLDVKSTVTSVAFAYFPLWLAKVRGPMAETMRLEPAAPTSVSELKRMQLPAGDLVRYDAALDAQAVEPTVPLEAMLAWIGQVGVTRDQVAEVSLVHVPLFTFHYQYAGTEYTAVVEAASGRVIANLYPAKAEAPYRSVAVAAAVVFLCLATFPVAGALVEPGDGMALGLLLCVGLGMIAAPILFAAAAWIAAKV